MIIGVVGYYGCGKDTVAEILENYGFVHISLSDMIREELKKKNIEITRENLIKEGNRLREEYGPSVLADRAIEKIKQFEKEGYTDFVITSIRNPYEVNSLKKRDDFVLIYIEALPEIRFARVVSRHRENDPKTFEEFVTLEEKEKHNTDPTKQSISDCVKMADYTIKNNGSLNDLRVKIKKLLNELEKNKE